MEPKAREIVYLVTPSGRSPARDFILAQKDKKIRAALEIRLYRAALGNFGDNASVGDGLREMRIHLGPGYRVYYGLDGDKLVVLVMAGQKDTQARDIQRAKELWAGYRAKRRS